MFRFFLYGWHAWHASHPICQRWHGLVLLPWLNVYIYDMKITQFTDILYSCTKIIIVSLFTNPRTTEKVWSHSILRRNIVKYVTLHCCCMSTCTCYFHFLGYIRIYNLYYSISIDLPVMFFTYITAITHC